MNNVDFIGFHHDRYKKGRCKRKKNKPHTNNISSSYEAQIHSTSSVYWFQKKYNCVHGRKFVACLKKSSCKKTNYVKFLLLYNIDNIGHFILTVVNITLIIKNSDKNVNILDDDFYVFVTKIRNTSTFMKCRYEIKTLHGVEQLN